MISAILRAQPEPIREPKAPQELERLILRCLRKKPGRAFSEHGRSESGLVRAQRLVLAKFFQVAYWNWALSRDWSHTFSGFSELAGWIAEHLKVESAVIDGEIACVDDSGRPVFRDLLFRRRPCVFVAFDLLFLNGQDLRALPLIERKAALKKLLRRKRSRILYLDHVESDGRLLFEQIVAMDLEGIVCKRRDSQYKVTEKPSRYWIKVKNSGYSQAEGRQKLFEERR